MKNYNVIAIALLGLGVGFQIGHFTSGSTEPAPPVKVSVSMPHSETVYDCKITERYDRVVDTFTLTATEVLEMGQDHKIGANDTIAVPLWQSQRPGIVMGFLRNKDRDVECVKQK